MSYKKGIQLSFNLLLMLMILVQASCQTMPHRPLNNRQSMTPEEKRLRSNARFFLRSSVEACLLTGGLSAIGSLLVTGGDEDDALKAAIIGCGVGVGANYYMQYLRTQYANDEQRMRQIITDLKKDNARLSKVVVTAQAVIDQDRNKIAKIDQAYQEKKISSAEARQQLNSVDSNQLYLEQTLASLKKRQLKWQQIAEAERSNQPSANMAHMDTEIEKMNQQIATLASELEMLSNRRSISAIG